MERSMEMSAKYVQLCRQYKFCVSDRLLMLYFIDEFLPITLHEGMFIPVIKIQGTDEQINEWIPKSENFNVIGCYAQTEIGHGSNLAGLETTATFVPESDEFEINSPTLTSTKWWIGGLGKMATHALVQAQLVIGTTSYGPHAFIVPLRDSDHVPLPGVQGTTNHSMTNKTVGDIGPKLGFAAIDNGYVRFNRIRIPRRNMLMRFAQVNASGEYSAPPHSKVGLGGMVKIRAMLVQDAWYAIARAAVIATRYCTVRRQFSHNGGKETQVIKYQMVQYRLFPIIAMAYAFNFSGKALMSLYNEMEQAMVRGDVSMLPEVHAVSSGLKSYCTAAAAESLEEARKVCGGHGYSMFSGIPYLFLNYVATNTYEGENYILTQQTARFLFKQINRAIETKNITLLRPQTKYLGLAALNGLEWEGPTKINDILDWLNSDIQLSLMAKRSARICLNAMQLLQRIPFDGIHVECSKASKAHSELLVAYHFIQAVKENTHRSFGKPLKALCDLYILTCIEKSLGEYNLTPAQSKLLSEQIRLVLKDLESKVIGLVDAFDFPDFLLNSALGRTDGDVYDALFKWALQEPLNESHVAPGFVQYMKPLIQSNL